jgi:hypothetical protein
VSQWSAHLHRPSLHSFTFNQPPPPPPPACITSFARSRQVRALPAAAARSACRGYSAPALPTSPPPPARAPGFAHPRVRTLPPTRVPLPPPSVIHAPGIPPPVRFSTTATPIAALIPHPSRHQPHYQVHPPLTVCRAPPPPRETSRLFSLIHPHTPPGTGLI